MPHSPGRLSALLLNLARAVAVTGAVALAAWLVACAHQRANPPEPPVGAAAPVAHEGVAADELTGALQSSKSVILLPAAMTEPVFLPSSKFLDPGALQQQASPSGTPALPTLPEGAGDAFYLFTSKSAVIRDVKPVPIAPPTPTVDTDPDTDTDTDQ